MNAHPHSVAAIQTLAADQSLGRRAKEILAIARGLTLSNSPLATGWTDRQMLQLTPYTDMNAVRPRITELIQDGLLIEVDAVTDTTTGKTVRRSRAATSREIALWQQRHCPTTQARQLDLI